MAVTSTNNSVNNPQDLTINKADVQSASPTQYASQSLLDRIKSFSSQPTTTATTATKQPTAPKVTAPVTQAPAAPTSTPASPASKQVTYYDPSGAAQTGYIINNLTYKDAAGKNRIDVGSTVNTGSDWYKLTEAGGVKTTDPTKNKQVTYYDPNGNQQTGYIIDGKTYADPEGKTRVGVGSLVNTAGGWYEMTDQGGVKIDAPYINNGKAEKLTPGPVNQFDLEYFMTPKENELYGLIDTLTQSYMNFQPTQTMSMDEAAARATAQLRQPFEQSLEDTMNSYDQSAIQRGMFGQQPTEALKRDAMANVELAEQTAIQDLASNLYQQDFSMGQSKDTQRLNLANSQLEAVRNVLFDEKSKKTEINAAKTAITTAQTAAQRQSVEDAYTRWNALGYADEVVADALGIAVGTQSQGNMEASVKNQYAMALEEYKTLLAIQEAQAEYGFDVSLAGYKSSLDLNEAAQKLQLDLVKMAQAANIDLQTDLTKMTYEYDLKKDYDSFVNDMLTPELKLELFEKAIDMSGVDQDKKDMAVQILQSKATTEYDALSLEDALKEYDNLFKDKDITKIMESYNGLLNIVGSEGIEAGLNIPESDYGDIYSGSNPLRGTGQQQ